MKKRFALLVVLWFLALAGCSGSVSRTGESVVEEAAAIAEQAIEEVTEHAAGETHSAHWEYPEEGQPDNWASLGFAECAGQTQSPIDLSSAAATDLENIRFAYGEVAVKILNNGHTLQVDQIEGSQIVIGEETYLLKQFHFHAPSEHTLNGVQFPLEMHLVHKTADESKAAVVGVFIAEGAANDGLAPVWSHLPAEESAYTLDEKGNKVYVAQDTGEVVSLSSLLPTEQLIYRYDGSLTTPPCTPHILWSVMQTPIEMSAEQIATFTAILSGNNRPVQRLNERELQLDTTP